MVSWFVGRLLRDPFRLRLTTGLTNHESWRACPGRAGERCPVHSLGGYRSLPQKKRLGFSQATEQISVTALMLQMGDATYYREEARRCRRMAAAAKTVPASRRWAELADEYDQLAVAPERSDRPAKRFPMQQQPVQQQQSKQKAK